MAFSKNYHNSDEFVLTQILFLTVGSKQKYKNENTEYQSNSIPF